MNIGLIGSSGALAQRLSIHHTLTGWTADTAAQQELARAGVQVVATAAEVAQRSEFVLLCQPDSPEGLVGTDVALVDVAAAGSAQQMERGEALLMVGGSDAHWTRALPVLRTISERVFHSGKRVGDGHAMKAIDAAMDGCLRLGTLEVVAMGRKMGLSLESMADLLNNGAGRNRCTEQVLPAIAQGRAGGDGAMSRLLGEMNQAIALGISLGVPTPLTNVARGLLQIGVNTLGDDARLEQAVDLVETMASTRLAPTAQAGAACDTPPEAPDGLKVGYVGLGAMGGALARRLMLMRPLSVFDTQAVSCQAFEAEGASVAPDLPALARACDVIVLCLPTSAIVGRVLFGPGGLAEGLSAGKIIIDQTSGDPNDTRRFAARLEAQGVEVVDAPVSGGPRGAVAGTISIMCGGSPAAFQRVKPLLASISPNIVYCGSVGNGHVAKIVNNAVSSLGRLVTYEGASLAHRQGLDLPQMVELVRLSDGGSLACDRILPLLASGRAASNFQLQLMVKDLRLAAALALSCGTPMMVSQAVRSIFETGLNQLGTDANIDEMRRLYEASGRFSFSSHPATV